MMIRNTLASATPASAKSTFAKSTSTKPATAKSAFAKFAFATLASAALLCSCKKESEPLTVKVGLLHSLTGAMAQSEIPVLDAELMAVEEINATGGVLGHRIEVVQLDGGSNPDQFATQARKMLTEENVATIFGCWTSDSRKKVKGVVEEPGIFGLLWYPLQYEGLEASPNIMYTGLSPNQQVIPAVEYCFKNIGKRMFIVGSDYVFPRTAGSIVRAYLSHFGGACVGESYVAMDCTDFSQVIKEIKKSRPAVILNTLNGISNKAFFEQLSEAGITSKTIPVMSLSVSETEVGYIGSDLLLGHYAAWSYMQTLSSVQNQAFVSRYRTTYGKDSLIGDPMVAGYAAVHLWAEACEKAGTFNVEDVRMAAKGLSFNSPAGPVTIDGENQHLKKRVRVGRINEAGLIDEVWCSDSDIKPDPYLSTYVWAKGL